MELFDINQDNKFVLNQLELGVHIKKAYKSLDQKNLSFTDLRQVSTNIQNVFSVKYPNIKFYDYGKINWDKALELKATANISAPDVIHLATAIEAGCDLLVTLDNFFKKEAKPYIEGCLPEQVEQVIRDLGFTL
jgi:predicted nucleic acid-binding protein